MSGDIYDSFNRPDAACPCITNPCDWPGFHCSVMNILNKMAPIYSRTQPGYFNDMDMLEVGNGGQTGTFRSSPPNIFASIRGNSN